ncbi:FadR/GntR family transcriptional regulator [Curvibacter sp. HBC61]|uniref:FadR/GntR family transcriptional regulator n=1 Tax=Curvibacter cyanobacteriorum TaxID=3026422 RepID=A0ABT5MYY3_9BURK|nr:FadR/GntR family transcriptional regulator [Curvibacter sp. HBC61]MDD0839042.1 FadR/GntR family transcriptional regulator [Curvibacter sp. HBC61]
MPIQSVEPKRLYRQIAEQLRGLIEQGEFAPGSRLPAERDLARQLGVSRPSVREALIALEVEGWVEVRTGSGVYVLARLPVVGGPATVQIAPTEWGPLELIRARRVVEGEIAAIAAVQAKRQHLSAMRQAIEAMNTAANQGVMPLDGDRAFHSAIVEACDNMVLIETIHHFWDSRRGPLFERLGGYFETLPSWRAAIEEHEAIYQAIAAHDGPAARAAMQRHMDNSHSRFSASWRQAKRSGSG